ncbi:DUF5787 family protein [Halanaeroarchaeum sulfurireducens]|uniref:Uncharacterized protein n=1 Tax=Halanaeroarchaeum sulfurireducens TaxID=1604004 RepID=A0A0N9N1N7_9EURY|nr:DUF5787 family protein [Halanaeroarchaeum sulfurireducens]ALG81629.1 hypothetical protein HLASA_0728 [Halanaeroarchaeum sulfurireducens]
MPAPADHEFGFELRVCAWAERRWPPDSEEPMSVVVARQLGTERRRWDTVVIETDPEALRRRAVFGSDRLDEDLLHVVRNAPPSWTFYRDALPHPGYPWRYVREAIHRANDRGAVETRKRANRIEIRRIAPYPDWIERVIAIENKPDLDASAARALRDQMERDVAVSLADEVWVATRRTDYRVEPALLEDLPIEVGILALDDGSAEVLWHPHSLATDRPGTVVEERASTSEYGERAARFRYVDPTTKRTKRLAIAERAYERGWRSYVETMRPDCRQFDLERDQNGYVPVCRAKRAVQSAVECRGSCSEFEPEPPAWRQRGWPIDGGPGTAIQRILADRRARQR